MIPHNYNEQWQTTVQSHELGPSTDDIGQWNPGPLNDVFRVLAETWCARNKASNASLAEHLDIRPQSCSQWKYGTAGRRPNWASIVKLCADLNMQVIVDGDDMRVIRRRSRRA